jgi:rhodanese-related sulfurtransferase
MTPPRSLAAQMLVVALAALGLALAANALHPGGIELGRDYFAKPQHEFQVVGDQEFREWATLLYEPEGDVVFLDVRRRAQYARGHVPGAYCLPRNDPAALEALLPVIRKAFAVVIYCHGGDCEDSIFTAEDLIYRHGIEPVTIWIYEPGWEEWLRAGGARREGAER